MPFYHCRDTLLRSNVSAITSRQGKTTHVYYQNNDGSIHVTHRKNGRDGDSWAGGDDAEILPAGKATLYTPLVALRWQDSRYGMNYRQYHLSPDFKLREVTLGPADGGRWRPGSLDRHAFRAAPYSQLSAIMWIVQGAPHIRLYYQAGDDKIHELCYGDGGWKEGPALPGDPLHGTSMSFVQRGAPSAPSIRGYYQDADLSLQEVCWDDGSGWNLGAQVGGNNAMPFRTAITACVPQDHRDRWIFIYHVDASNRIVECFWRAGSGWNGPYVFGPGYTPIQAESRLAAVAFFRSDGFDAQPDRRIYHQEPHCIWSERRIEKGDWQAQTVGLKNVGIAARATDRIASGQKANDMTPG